MTAVGGVLLVVDEDAQRAETLDGKLYGDGITVLHARSVGQALELLHALGTACCIVISMTLPARGAWELLCRIRSDRMPENACAAVLMGPGSVLESEPGTDPVIAKFPTPVDMNALCALLREHCAPKPMMEAVPAA